MLIAAGAILTLTHSNMSHTYDFYSPHFAKRSMLRSFKNAKKCKWALTITYMDKDGNKFFLIHNAN